MNVTPDYNLQSYCLLDICVGELLAKYHTQWRTNVFVEKSKKVNTLVRK